LIALVHPLICSSQATSGLPVHFHCLSVCVQAGTVVTAIDDTIAERKTITADAAA